MKLRFVLLLMPLLLLADDKSRLLALYNQEKYLQVCDEGFTLFRKNRRDEAFISLYAYACLNADLLDRLATPIVMLKHSKDARANAAYFSAILMKKKLLYHALLDGFDLKGIKLPASSHILSQVFDLFAAQTPQPINKVYTLNDPADAKRSYRLYTDTHDKLPKIVIEVYRSGILRHRHIYW